MRKQTKNNYLYFLFLIFPLFFVDESNPQAESESEVNQGAPAIGKTSPNEPIEEENDAHEDKEDTTLKSGKQGASDHGKSDVIEHGEMDTGDHGNGKQDTSDYGKSDIMEQGEMDTGDCGKGDTVAQGKQDVGDRGKEDISEHGKEDTCEHGKESNSKGLNTDIVADASVGGNTAKSEKKADLGQDKQDVSNECEKDTVGFVADNSIASKLEQESVGDIPLANVDQESDLGGHTDLNPEGLVSNPDTGAKDSIVASTASGIVDPSSEESERTAGAAAENRNIIETGTVVTMDASVDESDVCVDLNRDNDSKVHTEPSSSDAGAVADDDPPSKRRDDIVTEMEANSSELSRDTVNDTKTASTTTAVAMETVVDMETTEKLDTAGDNHSDGDAVSVGAGAAFSDSEESSESSSGEEEDQMEEQEGDGALIVDAKPPAGAADELEMLELELRARAIRSLMKKMGKE